MVKAYLRYSPHLSFGFIYSTHCNAIFDESSDIIFTGCDECVVGWNARQNTKVLSLKVPSIPPFEYFNSLVTFITSSPVNHKLLAVGYNDGSVRIWNIEEENIIMTFHGHKTAVTYLTYSGSGCYLASGSNDTDIIIYDILSESGMYRLRGHQDRVTCLHFIEEPQHTLNTNKQTTVSDPLYLISSSKDSFVKIWNLVTQSCAQSIADTSSNVWCFDVNTQMNRMVVASSDNVLSIYELNFDGITSSSITSSNSTQASPPASSLPKFANLIGALKRPKGKQRVTKLRYCESSALKLKGDDTSMILNDEKKHSNGGLLLCGGGSKNLEVYRVYDEEEIIKRCRRRHKRGREKCNKKIDALNIQIIETKQKLNDARGSHEKVLINNEIQLLEEEVLEVTKILDGHTSERQAVRDGKNVVKMLSDEMQYICSINTNAKIVEFDLFLKSRLDKEATKKYGNKLLLALNNSTIEIKRLPSLKFFDSLKGGKQSASDEGEPLNVSHNKTICEELQAVDFAGHASSIRSVAVSPDDALILSVSDDCIKIWSSSSYSCINTTPVENGLCGFFVAGNDEVIIGDKLGAIQLIDLRTCSVTHTLQAHSDAVQQLCETPTKDGFASISYDKSLKVYKLYTERGSSNTSRTMFKEINSHPLGDKGLDIKYSHKGKFLAVSMLDSSMQLFYADSFKLFLTLYGHKLPVASIDYSTDDTILASGSADKSIKLWSTDFGNILKSLRAHNEAVTQVKWLRDTHYLLSTSRDCVVKLWDCDHHQLITQLMGHPQPITCAALSYDAAFFVTAGGRQCIRSWVRTSDQLFIEEEREKEFDAQIEKEGMRDDLFTNVTAVHNDILLNRPTKKTIETIRSTERLMEMLDDAWEEYESECSYYKELREYHEAQRTMKTNAGSMSTIQSMLAMRSEPTRAPPKPELCGKSFLEYILLGISTLKSTHLYEVLIALPFLYAEKLLNFVGLFLESIYELQFTELNEITKQPKAIICFPIENACKCALLLIQVHFRALMTSPSHHAMLLKLRKFVHPLLLKEKEQFGMNIAALTSLTKQIEDERIPLNILDTLNDKHAMKSTSKKSNKKRKLHNSSTSN